MGHKKILSNVLSYIALLFFLPMITTTVYAQTDFDRSLPFSIQSPQQSDNFSGTLHIVAIMVEFQADSNSFTSGDGTFSSGSIPYLENPGTNIDPLPHNQKYFEAHLEFAKNYFTRMSKGELDIQFTVLEDIYTLPQKMEAYSPIGENPSLEPLADLAHDAWSEVEKDGVLPLSFQPDDRTAFVIFHAGVGRDIDLTGTILDKTPQDVPSVYLSKDAISRLFDDPSFSGFPINNGNTLVQNTLILPRTLSRAGEDISGDRFVLPLSINGMVTAQIASHLGLPDLFNTQTGESGIGRFGLMDGAGIFSYNGLFPPEMSAWEKIYAGWEEPFEVDYQTEQTLELPAADLQGEQSIAKISISNSEYFLVENRHRDVKNAGVTLTIQRPDGTRVNQNFTNSDTSFVFQEMDFADQLEPGVVINVDNFDFALPGGPSDVLESSTETESSRMLNGGILIWHIDEGVIQSQLSSRNGINDDPTRRGIELKEADGAQDIGRPTSIGFFQNEVNGSPFDFWWSRNDASVITSGGTITVYENRFAPDTTPNNSSHTGAPSFFELFDFSDNLPTASFSIKPASPNPELYELADQKTDLSPLFFMPSDNIYWRYYPLSISTFSTGTDDYALIPSQGGVYFYNFTTNEFITTDMQRESLQQPFVDEENGIFSVAENPLSVGENLQVSIFEWTDIQPTELWQFSVPTNRGFISSPQQDKLKFDLTTATAEISSQEVDDSFYPSNRQSSVQFNGYQSFIEEDGLLTRITPGSTFTSSININNSFSRIHTGLIERKNNQYSTYLLLSDKLLLFDEDEQLDLFRSNEIDWPAFADFTNDGELDILLVDRTENTLTAKNLNGAVLNNFPITPPNYVQFIGTPLLSDINGDGNTEILISGQDSFSLNIYGYNRNGELIEGFPLAVGGMEGQSDQPVHPAIIDDKLIAVSPTGDLKVWSFPNLKNTLWGTRYGSGNNKITGKKVDDDIVSRDFGILNSKETYNWPNPARDETTLRYQTSEPGEIQVKISTISGRLIYDQTIESRGGAPEEIQIDTSSWGSGGYLAVITARVNGKTERKLVKIAVAR